MGLMIPIHRDHYPLSAKKQAYYDRYLSCLQTAQGIQTSLSRLGEKAALREHKFPLPPEVAGPGMPNQRFGTRMGGFDAYSSVRGDPESRRDDTKY